MDSQSCSRLVRPYISALTISTDYVSLMERRARAFSSSISPPPTRQFGAKRSASSDSRMNFAVTLLRETRCPLWVSAAARCPLYPRKRTSLSAIAESALWQKRTRAPQQKSLPLRTRYRRSSTRYRQDRHYLHRFAWEDCEVRVVFEKLRGSLV